MAEISIARRALSVGEPAPPFSLPDAWGKEVTLTASAASVVVFTCNPCPYALAWHDRLLDVGRDYADRGVQTYFINSNDTTISPNDTVEKMRERLENEDWGDAPYLRDESQEIARAYGATNTPDIYVLDKDLVFRWRGAADGDPDAPTLGAKWLRDALDTVLEGGKIEDDEMFSVGCTIKWRSNA